MSSPTSSRQSRRPAGRLALLPWIGCLLLAGCGGPAADGAAPPAAAGGGEGATVAAEAPPVYRPPEDGRLTAEQVERFVAVRRAALERGATAAEWPKAVAAALEETGVDPGEHAWIEATVLGALADASVAEAERELDAEIAAMAEELAALGEPETGLGEDTAAGDGAPRPLPPLPKPRELAADRAAYDELAGIAPEAAPGAAAAPEPPAARGSAAEANLELVRSRLDDIRPLLVGDERALLPAAPGDEPGPPAPELPEPER